MKWLYKSPIGAFYIVSHSDNMFYIVFNDEYYGGYNSAVAAADDVFTFSTGCNEWDQHVSESNYQSHVPSSIHEWNRVL